jgi:UPF0271 protein
MPFEELRKSSKMDIQLNCDMGEGYALYKMGDDAALMPMVDLANIACGFHASDPPTMARTVALAKQHGKPVGAHPSLPDRDGFGRREMKIPRDELAAALIYQIGALKGFLEAENLPLNHIKPHGVLYGMAARDEAVAHAICDAAKVFNVPLFGMAGTLHETVCNARGVPMIGEFFADLEYDATGRLLITKEHPPYDAARAVQRVERAMCEGRVESLDGAASLPVRFGTICLHSDTPNAVEVVGRVSAFLAACRAP